MKLTLANILKLLLIILIPIIIILLSKYTCDQVSLHDKLEDSAKSQSTMIGHEDLRNDEDKRKERWEEYKIHVDLFKYYLDLILRTNIAVFAILGAILTYYFKNKGENKQLKKALLLPIILTLSLGGFYLYSACLWGNVSTTVNHLRESLGIFATPYVHILSVLLLLFGFVFLGIGDTLLWFILTDKVEKNETPLKCEQDTDEQPAHSLTSVPSKVAQRSE
jgi:phosphotransferase system  glucose/maltose/N-acetylglucosamine-specific IIC component